MNGIVRSNSMGAVNNALFVPFWHPTRESEENHEISQSLDAGYSRFTLEISLNTKIRNLLSTGRPVEHLNLKGRK
jgi:hypothetical protein